MKRQCCSSKKILFPPTKIQSLPACHHISPSPSRPINPPPNCCPLSRSTTFISANDQHPGIFPLLDSLSLSLALSGLAKSSHSEIPFPPGSWGPSQKLIRLTRSLCPAGGIRKAGAAQTPLDPCWDYNPLFRAAVFLCLLILAASGLSLSTLVTFFWSFRRRRLLLFGA